VSVASPSRSASPWPSTPPAANAAATTTLGLAVGGPAAIRGTAPLVELRLEDGGTAVLADIIVPDDVAGEVAAALAPLLARAEIVAAHVAAPTATAGCRCVLPPPTAARCSWR
jgi:hypothetical protein